VFAPRYVLHRTFINCCNWLDVGKKFLQIQPQLNSPGMEVRMRLLYAGSAPPI
jgi:hypothetical protein